LLLSSGTSISGNSTSPCANSKPAKTQTFENCWIHQCTWLQSFYISIARLSNAIVTSAYIEAYARRSMPWVGSHAPAWIRCVVEGQLQWFLLWQALCHHPRRLRTTVTQMSYLQLSASRCAVAVPRPEEEWLRVTPAGSRIQGSSDSSSKSSKSSSSYPTSSAKSALTPSSSTCSISRHRAMENSLTSQDCT
jgi:hypothetical protein